METIELKEGWLVRQMQEVRREVASWPEVMKPLTTINASLVRQPQSIGKVTSQDRSQSAPSTQQSVE